MRIIAGDKKGLVLRVPEGDQTRPTLSRIRESLFSMLMPVIADARVLDLYAGSGSLGFEALSRGAQHCTFIESGAKAVECLRENVAKLDVREQVSVIAKDVVRWLNATEWLEADIVFVDAPYDEAETARALAALDSKIHTADPLVVLQTASRFKIEPWLGGLEVIRDKRYGKTALYFLRKAG